MNKKHHTASAQIYFDNVSVHYYSKARWLGGKPFKALEKLDLKVETKNLAIVGPSGAGKSTLVELLFGMRLPSAGEVYLCGYPLSQTTDKQRKELCQHIQLIPQEPQTSLNPNYTVREILLESLINLEINADRDKRISQALRDVGLDTRVLKLNPQQLSVGQAQRVAIARALIVEPCVLVADEPTSSLDPVSRKQILDLLAHIQETRQMRLILVTHDLNAAQTLCDEILVLDKGRAVEHGPTNQITTTPSHAITRALLSAQEEGNKQTHISGEIKYAP